MNSREIAKNRLVEFGIKPSLQRLAIMEYLMNHSTHPTADMIFNDLFPSMPTLSKTTVYNTLRLLAGEGAILSLSIDEKNVRYDGDISNHAHFKCKKCGCLYDLPVEGMNSIHVENKGNLLITECHLYYKGFCERCKSEIV